MFVFQKNKSAVSPSCVLSSGANCYFLTVLQSIAQSVFNASQGVRDLGLLSWTPLTVFPPQVSCLSGRNSNCSIAYLLLVILNPLSVFPQYYASLLKQAYDLEPHLHG